MQSSSAALPLTHPQPILGTWGAAAPRACPVAQQLPAPSCTVWWAARVLQHWAENSSSHSHSSCHCSLPLLEPAISAPDIHWMDTDRRPRLFIHCTVQARAMINLASHTKIKSFLSSQKKSHQSSPWKAVLSQPGIQGVHSQLQLQ